METQLQGNSVTHKCCESAERLFKDCLILEIGGASALQSQCLVSITKMVLYPALVDQEDCCDADNRTIEGSRIRTLQLSSAQAQEDKCAEERSSKF